MADPSVGPIVLATDVEQAIKATVQDALPWYLAEVDEQQGLERGTTAMPKQIDVASDSTSRWLEAAPPSLVIACPGTMDAPEMHGPTASYGAWWQVNFGITAGGATDSGARALSARYAAALRMIIGQRGTMGGLCERASWLGERVGITLRDRSVVAAEVSAAVYVGRVMDTRGLLPIDLPAQPTDALEPTPTPSRVVVRTTR